MLDRTACMTSRRGIMPKRKHYDPGGVNGRVLHAVVSITLSLAVMGLVAYAFGRVTHTEWIWWLAPLTVALEASLLFRAHVGGSAAVRSPWELRISRDPGASVYLASSVVAAAVAAWGAYTGNRLAVITAAAFAILGRAFDRVEDPALEQNNEPA